MVNNPKFREGGVDEIECIKIVAYEPAYGIIGDPAKMNPRTRQSADHSMPHIVARVLKKGFASSASDVKDCDSAWKSLMLSPYDYDAASLTDTETRNIMSKVVFEHGGESYDAKYPEGIPTSVDITLKDSTVLSSGFVMYPTGHAANTTADLAGILDYKARHMLAPLVWEDTAQGGAFIDSLVHVSELADVSGLYGFDNGRGMRHDHPPIDG